MGGNYIPDSVDQASVNIPIRSYEHVSADLKFSAEHSCIKSFQQEETNNE